jgi:hypothetical protein
LREAEVFLSNGVKASEDNDREGKLTRKRRRCLTDWKTELGVFCLVIGDGEVLLVVEVWLFDGGFGYLFAMLV